MSPLTGHNHVQIPTSHLFSANGNGVDASLIQKLREHDMAWLFFARLVEQAGKNSQRFRVANRQFCIERHKNAVDVDVTERQWDFKEVFRFRAKDQVAKRRRPRLVGTIADRGHNRIVADHRNAATLEKGRALDRTVNRYAELPESATHDVLITPATPEMRPHQYSALGKDCREVARVSHVWTVCDVLQRIRIIGEDIV